MPEHYQHLGVLVLGAAVHRGQPLYPVAIPGLQTQTLIRECLGFWHVDENPMDAKIEREWGKDGLVGQEISAKFLWDFVLLFQIN